MSRRLKDIVLDLLNAHRIMSISTNRPDGWPQTTLVSYVNDGFFLYCFVARDSQKIDNILRDPRVSIAIGSDVTDPLAAQPAAERVDLLCIVPEIISVVDYSKGFGHSDLITFSERDLDFHIESRRDEWVDDGISGQPLSEARPGTDEVK